MRFKGLLLLFVLWLGVTRFVGTKWDLNHHLHPDERFLTMVAIDTDWPKSLKAYLATATSSLNPHNRGHSYYVYGTFPVFLVKAIADSLGWGDYDHLTLVGRALSGLMDCAIAVLVGLIAWETTRRKRAAVLAFGAYAVMVLPMQLAHFFAVDPYVVFFGMAALYCLIRGYRSRESTTSLWLGAAGFALGLGFASKASVLLIAPTLAIVGLVSLFKHKTNYLFAAWTFILIAILTVRFFQPYLFAGPQFLDFRLNPKVLANWDELHRLYSPETHGISGPVGFPPATLFLSSTPFWFPFENLMLWGLGIPLAALTLMALVYQLSTLIKHTRIKKWDWLDALFIGILIIFIAQAAQFAVYMRYFYLLYPLLAILVGNFLSHKLTKLTVIGAIFASLSLWSLAYLAVYTSPHSRVLASEWIYQNVPAGSTITAEHWDDPLPLNLFGYSSSIYRFVELPMYEGDTFEKWQKINSDLATVDYVVVSSNRQYGSLTGVPDRYPTTTKFYEDLFSEKTGFMKVIEFTSRPRFNLPGISLCIFPPWLTYGSVARPTHECAEGISIVDDYADESFTVYDHPKVTIFKRP